MLNNRTVLILGAGASMRYGYPSGVELKKMIVRHLMPVQSPLYANASAINNHEIIDSDLDKLIPYLIQNCAFPIQTLKDFYTDFNESPRASIDSFLQERKEFLEIGKILIAHAILRCENSGGFHDVVSNTEPSWYQYLFNEIVDQLVMQDQKLSLTVITYNYDRSFESYFVNGLIKTYGMQPSEAKRIFERIKVIHVHGTVGTHQWDVFAKPYGHSLLPIHIEQAANSLHIISEEDAFVETYREVRSELYQAENIFILGFGYHKANLERLNLTSYRGNIYSTRTGIEDLELIELNRATEGKIIFGKDKNHGIVDFFRKEITLNGIFAPEIMVFNNEMKRYNRIQVI